MNESNFDTDTREEIDRLWVLKGMRKYQQMEELILSKFLKIFKDGHPPQRSEFLLDGENTIISCLQNGVSIHCPELKGFTIRAGHNCVVTSGNDCIIETYNCGILTVGNDCIAVVGDNCTITTGDNCTVITMGNVDVKKVGRHTIIRQFFYNSDHKYESEIIDCDDCIGVEDELLTIVEGEVRRNY
jgi:hypothetical protein